MKINRAVQFRKGDVPEFPAQAANTSRLLYVHIPFCERLCPYCSFNRTVFNEDLSRAYWQALRKEISLYKSCGYNFSGVYVGGGTPTIQMDELEETLANIRNSFDIGEISVETNPNHLDDQRIEVLQRSGVNRLSVGVQSFDSGLLKAMDRLDKYGIGAEILKKLKYVSGKFDTLNADMIFNFAAQTPEILDRDLDTLLESGVDQITYYPLMTSDSTRQLMEKNIGRVDYGREESYYKQIVRRLVPPYRFSSVWCFSRKEAMRKKAVVDEYIISYDEYVGAGSGSFGYLNGVCYANTFNIEEYITMLNRGDLPLMASRRFGTGDRILYDLLMMLFGLNLNLDAFRSKYGGVAWKHLWLPFLALRLLGAIGNRMGEYYVTDRGRYFALIMMREFFIGVNNFRDFCRN
jgi:menaquinone C8-methyltransferase